METNLSFAVVAKQPRARKIKTTNTAVDIVRFTRDHPGEYTFSQIVNLVTDGKVPPAWYFYLLETGVLQRTGEKIKRPGVRWGYAIEVGVLGYQKLYFQEKAGSMAASF
jgi:hypothetical protein